jgi:REP element-mobilizing transposase RayT
MSVRRAIAGKDGVYFITITNCRWHSLFEHAAGYDAVYEWFNHLKSKGHYIIGYVIMPNHLHCLIAFRNTGVQTINTIIGNGKRFMTYELVNRLQSLGASALLQQLSKYVNLTDKRRGKLHEVFEPSFDAKPCYSTAFILQKLNYMHENPCRGKWNLAESPIDYVHSSARFCLTGVQGHYALTRYLELQDIDLTIEHG